MPAAKKLTPKQLESALAALPGWKLRDGKLWREFKFADFSEAFAFMTRVALAAEQRDHHPDWSNVWNRVSIELVTHDARAVTEKDVALARVITRLAE